MANLRRNETIQVVNGSYVAPGAGYFVNAYAAGAIARGVHTTGATTTTLPVYDGSGIAVNDYIMKGIDPTTVYLVTAVSYGTPGANTITVNGTAATCATGNVFICLGLDTMSGGTPDWDGSTATIYSTPDTSVAVPDSIVTADSGGNYGYWYDVSAVIWELIRNTAGVPVAYVIQNSNILLTSSSSSTTDNSIARWDGTTGLIIQGGYSSNTPTITDAGGIVAPGSHTLGPVAVTGALSATGTLSGAATSVTTLTTSSTATIGGNTSVAGTLTQTGGGATSLSGTLGVTGATTLADVTLKEIYGIGTALVDGDFDFTPSPGGADWGVGATATVTAGGNNTRFTVMITAGSSATAANAKWKLTFKDSGFASAPYAIVTMKQDLDADASIGSGSITGWSSTSTTLTVNMVTAPTANLHYYFTVLVIA